MTGVARALAWPGLWLPVAVIHEKTRVAGWPEKHGDDGLPKTAGSTVRLTLAEALTTTFPCDAHLVAYSTPSVLVQTSAGPRDAACLRLNAGAESLIPGGYAMAALIVDVDGPRHDFKRAVSSAREMLARASVADAASLQTNLADLEARALAVDAEHDGWWQGESAKLCALLSRHPVFAFTTSNGYRIVGHLPVPMVVASGEDRAHWTTSYLTWLAHLGRSYRIAADPACSYPECLFRLPYVVRDGVPQRPTVVGDASTVGAWNLSEMDGTACAAAARELWPERMRGGRRATASGSRTPGATGPTATPDELAARWLEFSEAERQRRIALYVSDLHRLETTRTDVSGRATRLVAARSGVRGFGIGDADLVIDLMLAHWAPRCQPQWTRADLIHKVESAARANAPIDFNMPEVREAKRIALAAAISGRARADQPMATPPAEATAAEVAALAKAAKDVRRQKRAAVGDLDELHALLLDRVIKRHALVTKEEVAAGLSVENAIDRVTAVLAWRAAPETRPVAVREFIFPSVASTLGCGQRLYEWVARAEQSFARASSDRLAHLNEQLDQRAADRLGRSK